MEKIFMHHDFELLVIIYIVTNNKFVICFLLLLAISRFLIIASCDAGRV